MQLHNLSINENFVASSSHQFIWFPLIYLFKINFHELNEWQQKRAYQFIAVILGFVCVDVPTATHTKCVHSYWNSICFHISSFIAKTIPVDARRKSSLFKCGLDWNSCRPFNPIRNPLLEPKIDFFLFSVSWIWIHEIKIWFLCLITKY